MTIPSHKKVVIIGGGIVGCSLLYHLAREGWTDCLLVEKAELTSGSTWHAAGAITHSLGNAGLARTAGYGIELYQQLEAETGQSVTWHGCGSLRLAYTDDELDYLRQILSIGRSLGHPMDIIGPREVGVLHPFYRLDGLKGALHTPADGHVDPSGATFAFAKGARQRGAEIARHTRVTGVRRAPSGEWVVETDKGSVTCELVVNAAGTYAHQVGRWFGLELPIVNAAHQYLVTEPIAAIANLGRELPLVRDGHAISAYFRQEGNSILMGFYEKHDPHLVWLDGTPWSSESELFAPDLDAIIPSLEVALERMPILREAGIRRVVNGAIMYTPDGLMLAGPAPGVPNVWCACGVSVGIAWGPGVGKYLAQWMAHGAAEISMRQFDPRRFGAWASRDYAIEKVKEDYVLRHEVSYPGRDRPAARPVRKSTLYSRLKEQGAVFEQMFGWERPYWFAHGSVEHHHRESFRRTPVQRVIADEVKAVRERAGVVDLSGFGKVEVAGPDCAALLDRLTTNRLPARDGALCLTYCLNATGTIEFELTCLRLAPDRYYLALAALDEIRFLDWLEAHRRPGERIEIRNVSDSLGCISIAGPQARRILSQITAFDLGNTSFPWLSGREIVVGGQRAHALRVSITGELGYELYTPMPALPAIHEALMEAGRPFGITNFGTAALNAMRIEKGHKGTRELNATTTLAETGMMRFAKLDKGFFGHDAMLARSSTQTCVCLEVTTIDSDCHGAEAVYEGDRVVGSVTSGAWAPYLERSLAFAFVCPEAAGSGSALDVMVLGERRPARILTNAYDALNIRPRAPDDSD
jgi:dimethylglycine dehydrogenase